MHFRVPGWTPIVKMVTSYKNTLLERAILFAECLKRVAFRLGVRSSEEWNGELDKHPAPKI
eukprot:2368322-Pyramimonas_sp.AAC.1